MVATIDVSVGELYALVLEGEEAPVLAKFAEELPDDILLFRRLRTHKPIELDLDEFERMRSDGRADRISTDQDGQIIPEREIDPLAFADPDEPGITLRERGVRLRKQEILQRKRTLRFYVLRYDDMEAPTKGRSGVRDLIADALSDAIGEGFTWKPSASSVLRAAQTCGTPKNRPLTAFLPDPPELKRERRWPREVVESAARAIEAYWGDPKITVGDALAQFGAEAEDLRNKHALPLAGDAAPDDGDDTNPAGEQGQTARPVHRLDPEEQSSGSDKKRKAGYAIPVMETVRLWLHANADWHSWAQRYGIDNANRRFRGRGKAIEATRPLEYVLFDHTKIDAWAVVVDDDGEPLFVARAWLTFAIDLYSRMVLGAIIGYEPPSIHSVTACLRQVVRRKQFLLDRYGDFKGASDGYGRPHTIIVDNGKEFVSPSFQASCEALGINVIWAPVKTPTFKPHVERLFGTFNSILWHKLPGGLPLTPQLRKELDLEPEAEAVYTKNQLEDALWNAIVTLYHVETQSGINMAPALKWARGLSRRSRATVDAVAKIDRLVGRTKMAQLSAEGVTIEGNRFHFAETTTMLMNRLGRFAKLSRQRKGVTSSRTVWVRATWDPGDVTQVHIWDHTTRTSVTMPNVDPWFSDGLSWYAAKKVREWADQRNLSFHSDVEKAAARKAHREFLLDIMPGISSVERHRRARVVAPRSEVMPGTLVERVKVPTRDPRNLEHDIAAERSEHTMDVKKGRPFGGKAGARKAASTRKRNRAVEKKATTAAPAHSVPQATEAPKVDLAALRARVAQRIANGGGSK